MNPMPTLTLEADPSREGEGEACLGRFEDLVLEHQSMVFSLALHTLRDRALAEDVAQEVFWKLSEHLPRLEGPRHVLFWLRQVTSRLCIDELRRTHRSQASLEEVGEPSVEHPQSDPFLDARLRHLVGELPERQRMALVLRYQEDLDFPEIAAILQEPLPTVKSRVQRALARLRQALGSREHDHG
jgi:RNA polymerase sigma-70 factor (ECF subfamily)